MALSSWTSSTQQGNYNSAVSLFATVQHHISFTLNAHEVVFLQSKPMQLEKTTANKRNDGFDKVKQGLILQDFSEPLIC